MQIHHLKLTHFRNHTNTEIGWAPHINLILGTNGSGKTNLIDAIHVLCMSRSFVTTSDQFIAEKGFTEYAIQGSFSGALRSDFSISCQYKRGDGKSFFVNDSPLNRLADLIGRVPVVVLSPQDRNLTSEGPIERRRFIDVMISQLSHTYLSDLIEYKRILKQRNTLLMNPSLPLATLESFLEPWDHQLAEMGSRIIFKRKQTLAQFQRYLEQAYQLISTIKLKPRFDYKSIDSANEGTQAEIKAELLQLVQENRSKEIERGHSSIGPHRDDLTFFLDDMDLRKFGSQGQHRLFALSLKMAELLYLSDELDDLPIFLLDDMFGDLDPEKIETLLSMLQEHKGQTFITAANPSLFGTLIDSSDKKNSIIHVKNGQIVA